jgi:hypothetical protein
MQEQADGVSEAEANSVFNNAPRKVIKGIFKYVCCIFFAAYYMQVLKQQMKPMQVKGIYLTKN